jgi:hypothetical protein
MMLAGRVQKVSEKICELLCNQVPFYTLGIEHEKRTGNCYRLKKVTNRTIVQIVCRQSKRASKAQ